MKAIRSSETSVNKISTRRHIPEDGILHSHRRENLKSYILDLVRDEDTSKEPKLQLVEIKYMKNFDKE
jgi:hypothetical protein